jgi:hypothetical protein
MQRVIRNPENASAMTPEIHSSFVEKSTQGKLLAPEVPGRAIASLALKPRKELSGKFLNWDDPALA